MCDDAALEGVAGAAAMARTRLFVRYDRRRDAYNAASRPLAPLMVRSHVRGHLRHEFVRNAAADTAVACEALDMNSR